MPCDRTLHDIENLNRLYTVHIIAIVLNCILRAKSIASDFSRNVPTGSPPFALHYNLP